MTIVLACAPWGHTEDHLVAAAHPRTRAPRRHCHARAASLHWWRVGVGREDKGEIWAVSARFVVAMDYGAGDRLKWRRVAVAIFRRRITMRRGRGCLAKRLLPRAAAAAM